MECLAPHSSEHLLPARVRFGGRGQHPLGRRKRGPRGQTCRSGSLRGRRSKPERRLTPLVPACSRHGNPQGISRTCQLRPGQPIPGARAAGGAAQQQPEKIQPGTQLCQPRASFPCSFATGSTHQGVYNTTRARPNGKKTPRSSGVFFFRSQTGKKTKVAHLKGDAFVGHVLRRHVPFSSVGTFLSRFLLVSPCVLQVKRTNLKKPSSERTGHGLRVKFNPLALLLDASLEGEFDLVQRIIYEVMSDCDGLTGSGRYCVCLYHKYARPFGCLWI